MSEKTAGKQRRIKRKSAGEIKAGWQQNGSMLQGTPPSGIKLPGDQPETTTPRQKAM